MQRICDGRTDGVLDYLAAGHSATDTDENGVPLIRWCAYHGDVAAVRVLLERGETLESLGDNADLHGAAFHGHWQLCQFLVEQGADAGHRLAGSGESVLHAAFCKANRPIYDHVAEVLLAAGADPNAATIPGRESAMFMRDVRTRGETALHRAAAFGTENAIRMLLGAGAERQTKDCNGDTPLSWASWHLRPPSVLRLLCYGDFSIHPDNRSDYDHGAGWGQLDVVNMSKPHTD